MKSAPNQVLAVKPSSINTFIFYCLSGWRTIPRSPAAATIPLLCGACRSALESCYYSVIGAISDCYCCSSPCGGGEVPLVGAAHYPCCREDLHLATLFPLGVALRSVVAVRSCAVKPLDMHHEGKSLVSKRTMLPHSSITAETILTIANG